MMQGITLVLMIAVTVEALVEYTKSIVKSFMQQEGFKIAVTQIIACVVGVFICIASGADLYTQLGVHFHIPYLGCVLTGIFASRGANFVSDLVKKVHG